MKLNDYCKFSLGEKTKKIIVLVMLTFMHSAWGEVYPNTDVEIVHKEEANEAMPPAIEPYQKDGQSMPRSGLYLSPMIPHSVKGMEVSKNSNRCLDCHSLENAPYTGATKPSKTHFYDREGNLGNSVSPRRYFCLQCHTPQTKAPLVTGQNFKPNENFNAEQDKQKLPPVTKTPHFAEQFQQTLEDFSHYSDGNNDH